jgi:hypothetical protein
MKINKEKTKTMIISKDIQTHSINIEDTQIEQVEKFKYLGVILSRDGKMDEEIRERTAAAGRLFNAIKTPFLGKKEIPKKTKVEIFRKVAVPVLTYSCESWTTTTTQKSKIRCTEMRFLRKIEGKTRMDHIRNETFRQILNTKPVEEIVQEGQLRWLGHMYRMEEDRIPKRAYEARAIGKKGRGRPRKKWNEEVKQAVENRGMNWKEIKELTKDRNKWRDMWRRKPK